MPDPIKRAEKVHIDELSCKATSTVQWFLEKRSATHPITHNNELEVFICGGTGFADIAAQIKAAKNSIDICCWGFDPGMELIREGTEWPRGETYGDLLIAAGKRHVQVRLLVWYGKIGSPLAMNMPGYSHGTTAWRYVSGSTEADRISAQRSLALAEKNFRTPKLTFFASGSPLRGMGTPRAITPDSIPSIAREEYCHSWYQAAFAGLFHGIKILTRSGDAAAISASLGHEKYQPDGIDKWEVERHGMAWVGTHHQKTLLIDYDFNAGAKAVGYVKGLNSVTDYWDTEDHLLENPKREAGGNRERGEAVQFDQNAKADTGFKTFKPYRDYACRIRGGALVSVHANFISAWRRAGGDTLYENPDIPSALKRKGAPGSNSSVQIIRTQPDEKDKTAKEMYFLATDVAAAATGYLYIENQYFQYQEWSERLIQARKNVMARWKAAAPKAGKTKGDMPLLHVFIVIPVPERAQMVPRTYDALAVLGQQVGMTGQSALIDMENKKAHTGVRRDELGNSSGAVYTKPTVVEYANGIDKPSVDALEKKYGLKVAVAMLQTSRLDGRRMRYREIYIHSKLLLVDDSFFSLGSANLNQRSMAVDSEINLATNDAKKAADLRQKIWGKLSGGTVDGKGGSASDIKEAFSDWTEITMINSEQKRESKPMTGFLLPIRDNRSSTIRLG
ncbi:phospholipase D-like domain-containing protein [Massilia aurea]|uniref:phospholipase D-like domain-containing protein n=1 Tax=Massilia aurea TaxID=373040 RepID=UPI003462D16C